MQCNVFNCTAEKKVDKCQNVPTVLLAPFTAFMKLVAVGAHECRHGICVSACD